MRPSTVREVMTHAPLVLSATATVREALELAARRKLHHVLYRTLDGGVGVSCLCDMLGAGSLEDALRDDADDDLLLAALGYRRTVTVGPDSTVGEAAQRMLEEEVGCLPVLEGAELVGVVTREDLWRAGVKSAHELSAVCAHCGSTLDVRHLSSMEGAGLCGDCWRRLRTSAALADDGGGY